MSRLARRGALVCALVLLAAGLPACGGGNGDDGGGGLSSLLNGPFYVFALEGSEDIGGRTVRCSYGEVTFDGAEGLTGSINSNENGSHSSTPESISEDYFVGQDGTFSLEGDMGAFALGGVTTDGTFGILGSREDGDNPQIIAVAKRGSGFSQASLSGLFHVVAFELSSSMDNRGLAGTFSSASGTGTFTVTTENEDGAQGPGFTDSVTYSVNGDGSFLWNGTRTAAGQLIDNGTLGIAHATTGYPAKLALVRQATSASVATLIGEYFLISFRHRGGALGYISETGRLTANGAGGGSWFSTTNDDGTIGGDGGPLTQYTVQPNGELNVDFGNGIEAEGGVSADGRFAILGGGASGPPYFALLIRVDFTTP